MTQQESLAQILLRMFLTWSKSYTTIFYIEVFEGQGALTNLTRSKLDFD